MILVIQRIINSLTRRRYRPSEHYARKSLSSYDTRHYKASDTFPKTFYKNLRRTVSWTESIIATIDDVTNINYSRIFRCTNLIYRGKPFYSFDVSDIAIPPALSFDYKAVLSEALSIRPETTLSLENLHDLGQVLRFEIDITTYDGAPCAENGLVDQSDIPPIDTWFYVTNKYLYCWIPKLFISKMEDVIGVEFFGSYEWIDLDTSNRKGSCSSEY